MYQTKPCDNMEVVTKVSSHIHIIKKEIDMRIPN
jgi:hypothetical protein